MSMLPVAKRILIVIKNFLKFLIRGIAKLLNIDFVDVDEIEDFEPSIKIYFRRVGVHIKTSMDKIYEEQDEEIKKKLDDFVAELEVN